MTTAPIQTEQSNIHEDRAILLLAVGPLVLLWAYLNAVSFCVGWDDPDLRPSAFFNRLAAIWRHGWSIGG